MSGWIYLLRPPRQTFADDMTEHESAVMREHFAYLQRLLDEGTLVLAGPALDPLFGIAVFEAEDEDAARAIMEADPAIRSGLHRGELTIESADVMKLRQISAGTVPPLTFPSDLLSSRPTQTPTTRSPAKPMKKASRFSCVVPVLLNVGTTSAALRPVPSFAAA